MNIIFNEKKHDNLGLFYNVFLILMVILLYVFYL